MKKMKKEKRRTERAKILKKKMRQMIMKRREKTKSNMGVNSKLAKN